LGEKRRVDKSNEHTFPVQPKAFGNREGKASLQYLGSGKIETRVEAALNQPIEKRSTREEEVCCGKKKKKGETDDAATTLHRRDCRETCPRELLHSKKVSHF